MKKRLFMIFPCISLLFSACSTPTPITSSPTPFIRQVTPSAITIQQVTSPTIPPTPLPIEVKLEKQALVTVAPDSPACQDYTYLNPGTNVRVIAIYGDFAQVEYKQNGNIEGGWIPRTALELLPPSVPDLSTTQIDWKSVVNYTSWIYYSPQNGGSLKVDPQIEENSDIVSDDAHHPVSVPLRIRFGMNNTSSRWGTVKLDGIDPLPDRQTWWQGVHRMDIFTSNGYFEICVRDGTQEDCNVNFVTPIPQSDLFAIVFNDPNGKTFQIWDKDNLILQEIDLTSTPGLQMSEGLFPSGWFQFGTSVGPPGTMTLDHLSIETPSSGVYGNDWKTEPGLADLAHPLGIEIGAEMSLDTFKEVSFCTAAKHDFNLAYLSAFTNAQIWRGPEEYDFTMLDREVYGMVKNGYTIYASHLVWGSYDQGVLPDWLKKGDFSKEQLLQILENHIKTLVSRYKDQITYWSIANEATVRDLYYGSDFWFDHIGPEYIEKSFQWAREVGPDEILVFNADNNESPRDANTSTLINLMHKQVKNLKEKGVPIDIVGMQMHIFLPWNSAIAPEKDDVVATMKRFGELDVQVMITEMDVNLHQLRGTQEEKIARQAQIYSDMMSACIEAGNCIAFSTWGISDAYSWITCLGEGWICAVYSGPMPDAAPLLFDINFQPKSAYNAVREVLLGAQK